MVGTQEVLARSRGASDTGAVKHCPVSLGPPIADDRSDLAGMAHALDHLIQTVGKGVPVRKRGIVRRIADMAGVAIDDRGFEDADRGRIFDPKHLPAMGDRRARADVAVCKANQEPAQTGVGGRRYVERDVAAIDGLEERTAGGQIAVGVADRQAMEIVGPAGRMRTD